MKHFMLDDYERNVGSVGVGRGLKVSRKDRVWIAKHLRQMDFEDSKLEEIIVNFLTKLGYKPNDPTEMFTKADFEQLNTGIPYEEYSSRKMQVWMSTEKIVSQKANNELSLRLIDEMRRERGLD